MLYYSALFPTAFDMAKRLHCAFYNTLADMREYTHRHLRGHRVSVSTVPLTAKNANRATEVLAIFVDSKITPELFKKLPKLKLIATMSTGFDHIDIEAAKKRGIPVCNVPTYGENTVAEHAMALILALSRRIYPSVKRVKEGSFTYENLRGFDLKGKTVGIIGAGHIGLHLIDMLSGFETTVLAYDPYARKELKKSRHFTYTSLSNLLARSDIISLHVPLTPQTSHLINMKNVKKIKKGAYIINTARGGLIDPEALLWGLENGYVAGAGLDVLEKENYIQHAGDVLGNIGRRKKSRANDDRISLINNILIDDPRVLVTPHNAFNSTEAVERIFEATIENIKAFISGHPQNDVTANKNK